MASRSPTAFGVRRRTATRPNAFDTLYSTLGIEPRLAHRDRRKPTAWLSSSTAAARPCCKVTMFDQVKIWGWRCTAMSGLTTTRWHNHPWAAKRPCKSLNNGTHSNRNCLTNSHIKSRDVTTLIFLKVERKSIKLTFIHLHCNPTPIAYGKIKTVCLIQISFDINCRLTDHFWKPSLFDFYVILKNSLKPAPRGAGQGWKSATTQKGQNRRVDHIEVANDERARHS